MQTSGTAIPGLPDDAPLAKDSRRAYAGDVLVMRSAPNKPMSVSVGGLPAHVLNALSPYHGGMYNGPGCVRLARRWNAVCISHGPARHQLPNCMHMPCTQRYLQHQNLASLLLPSSWPISDFSLRGSWVRIQSRASRDDWLVFVCAHASDMATTVPVCSQPCHGWWLLCHDHLVHYSCACRWRFHALAGGCAAVRVYMVSGLCTN